MTQLPNFVTNKDLFREYYLAERLAASLPLAPDEPRDRLIVQQQADSVMNRVAARWTEVQGRLGDSEENVADFVKFVSEQLGMSVSGQSQIKRDGQQSPMRVDITLFGNEAAANRFAGNKSQHSRDRFAEAFTVVEVEHRGAEFDTGKSSNTNPSYQITNYLHYTALPWGILTDGARWRIYQRTDPLRTDVYFEVNLAQILAIADHDERAAAFTWFYAFFRAAAFDRFDRQSFLDKVRLGSEQHAVGLQRSLRRQAFAVVEELARGIYVVAPALDMVSIYDHATIILYRLLFIKFAEDRGILPLENPTYRRLYGFSNLQDELLSKLDDPSIHLGAGAGEVGYWRRLLDFFDALNNGNANAGIYGYNGGLFKPERIAGVAVPDYYLARALDQLARVQEGKLKRKVDYRELQPRHLGSIYEGLLEQQLVSAGQELRLVSVDGSSERHDSGSYYTPDWVVDYIVAQTVEPLCAGRTATEIERLRIIDPAMGSGHFLLTALQLLASRHAQADKEEAIRAENGRMPGMTDTDYAQLIGALLKQQPISDAEIARSARQLAEQCIYGVDLNPLAVELAKLALWISTLSRDKALSFLDHHLKVGDSLLGAAFDFALLGALPQTKKGAKLKPLPLFQHVWAMQAAKLGARLADIAQQPSDTAAQVQAKDAEYAQVQATTAQFRNLADVWLTPYLGAAVSDAAYINASQVLGEDAVTWAAHWDADLQQAAAVARARRAFHWRLEFPDVFDGGGAEGFDAVIGNPPYVRQERLREQKLALAALFPDVYSSVADLYVYFFARGLELVRDGGWLGYIAANKFMRAGYGAKLRQFLRRYWLVQVLDFGDLPVFEEATTYPAIYVITKQPAAQGHTVLTAKLDKLPVDVDELAAMVGERAAVLPQEGAAFADAGWSLGAAAATDLLAHMEKVGRPLGEYIPASIRRGILTGFNEAFIIDAATRARLIAEDERSAEIIKPFMIGEDVRRYYLEQKQRYIILTYVGVPISNYPAVLRHLTQYQAQLERRYDKGNHWWELRHCDYYADFEQLKIIYPVMAQTPRFTLDEVGYYSNDKTFIIPVNDKYLLGLLNSRLIWYYLEHIVSKVQGDTSELRGIYMERVPIVVPAQVTAAGERERQLAAGQELFAGWQDDDAAPAALQGWVAAVGDDVRAALLAELAAMQLDLHRRRRDEVNRFLAARAAHLGVDIAQLTGKEAIRNYAAGDFARFIAALNKNPRILRAAGIDLGRDRTRQQWQQNFDDSLATLRPLTQQIARADWLIDQLVYALYRLDATAIALVEGTAASVELQPTD